MAAMSKSKKGMGTGKTSQYMAKGGKKMMMGGKNPAAKVAPTMGKGGKYKMGGGKKGM